MNHPALPSELLLLVGDPGMVVIQYLFSIYPLVEPTFLRSGYGDVRRMFQGRAPRGQRDVGQGLRTGVLIACERLFHRR